MSRIAITRPVTGPACHTPCALPYHQPGQRVQWQVWSRALGRFVWRRGTVLAHANRTLTISPDDGDNLTTSCGHVTGDQS